MQIIDTHVHFYDVHGSHPLLWPAQDSPLYQTHLPDMRLQQETRHHLLGTVAIETSNRFIDDQWLLDLSANEPTILAVIANLGILDTGFEQRLAYALKYPKFRGIRLRPIKSFNLSCPTLYKNLSRMPNHSVIEAGCPTRQTLAAFSTLADSLPNLTFVLDHFGHPKISSGGPDPNWESDITQFAQLPNTYCKLTSLSQFFTGANVTLTDVTPYLLALSFAFGQHRLCYGSNWPPVLHEGNIEQDLDTYKTYFGTTNKRSRAFFIENATGLYQLD